MADYLSKWSPSVQYYSKKHITQTHIKNNDVFECYISYHGSKKYEQDQILDTMDELKHFDKKRNGYNHCFNFEDEVSSGSESEDDNDYRYTNAYQPTKPHLLNRQITQD